MDLVSSWLANEPTDEFYEEPGCIKPIENRYSLSNYLYLPYYEQKLPPTKYQSIYRCAGVLCTLAGYEVRVQC